MSGSASINRRIWWDGAVRSLPVWLGITLLSTNVMALVIAAHTARQGFPGIPAYQLIFCLWLPVLIFLLLGKVRARSSRLDLALPLSARRLWLSHTLALLVAAALILALAFAVLAGIGALLSHLYGRSEPALPVLPLVAPVAAAATLAVLLLQGLQPGVWKPVGRVRDWLVLIGGLTLLPAILIALAPWRLATAGSLLLLAAVLARHTWGSLPAAFELAPLAERASGHGPPSRPSAALPAEALAAGPPLGRTAVAGLLFRILHNAPPWKQLMPWVLYFFVLLASFFLAGGFSFWFELDESRILNLPIGTYMLFTSAGILTYHLHRLDPLPISRPVLLRILVLPSLVFFCLGWGAGRWLSTTVVAESRPLMEYRVTDQARRVQVHPAFMAFSTDGEAPLLAAPWGETHRAWHRPLFRGSRVLLYSPFSAAEPTSVRFEALMTSRAIERVYGETLTPEEAQRRFFEVRDGRIVALESAGLSLSAEVVDRARPAVADTPIYLMLTLVPWLLVLAGFVRTFRATSSVRFIRSVYWIGLSLLLLAMFGQVITAITGLYSPVAAHGLLVIFSAWLGAKPLLVAGAWVASLGLVYLSYRLVLAQFRRAELPASPLHCSLIDWDRSD